MEFVEKEGTSRSLFGHQVQYLDTPDCFACIIVGGIVCRTTDFYPCSMVTAARSDFFCIHFGWYSLNFTPAPIERTPVKSQAAFLATPVYQPFIVEISHEYQVAYFLWLLPHLSPPFRPAPTRFPIAKSLYVGF
jgi:hypothetical protein